MGEVWRAHDQRLNRFVAIKFLPEAASATARERFQREALAIAALNHPNICTLHEATEQYLVMELLEGETLYARLQRGPVPPQQITQWGVEIADALGAAHAKGILHRDLKPANIFITQRGTVKVLDFGLAQFALAAAADAEAPTITTPEGHFGPLTTPGTTMGTYAYMSPEQARGEPTDARSDIFSLGTVLYEATAGKPAFNGRTTADLTAAVLTFMPPPAGAGRLDDIIGRCLEKDPALRYQSAADLHSDLKRLQASASQLSAPVVPAARAPRRHWLWPAVAAAAIAVGGFAWLQLRTPAPTVPPQLSLQPLTYSGHIVDAVISPDGKFLAHVDATPQGYALRLLSIASGSDIQIVPPGEGCCQSPSFSPDGGQVYFLQSRVLKAVPVLGGAERVIAHGACSGAGFAPDGSEIAYVSMRSTRTSLMLAKPDGAATRELASAPAGSGYPSQCWAHFGPTPTHAPAWSPDGHRIALLQNIPGVSPHIVIAQVDSGQTRQLPEAVSLASTDLNWLGAHTLVFTAALPASAAPQLWEMSDSGTRLTRLTNDLQGYSMASLSATGALALTHSSPTASLWVARKPYTAFRQLPGGGADLDGVQGLAWTPAADLVTTRSFAGKTQLWAEAADGSGAHPLDIGGAPREIANPQVAPNGQIVFTANLTGAGGVYRVNADGTDLVELAASPADGLAVYPAVLAGGHTIAYYRVSAHGQQQIWAVPLAGGSSHPLWSGRVMNGGDPITPDGSHMFLLARPAGAAAAGPIMISFNAGVVRAVPLSITVKEGMRPFGWTPDGRAITFVRRAGSVNNIWAMPIAGGKPYAITRFTDLQVAAYAFARDGSLAVSREAPNSDAVLATGLTKKP